MTTKIIFSILVAFVAGLFVCAIMLRVNGVGAPTGLNSINLAPSATAGDSYALAVNGTQVLDMNGNVSTTNAIAANGITNTGAESITGTLTQGGGTPIIKTVCASTSKALASTLTGSATTSFDIAITGATTSLNQVFSASAATTTAGQVQVTAEPTSTTGFATILLRALGGIYQGTAATTYSVCYTQF